MDEQPKVETCVHCGEGLVFGVYTKDEWSHWHGGTWCRDSRGYTATPLQRATPTYHGPEDVL